MSRNLKAPESVYFTTTNTLKHGFEHLEQITSSWSIYDVCLGQTDEATYHLDNYKMLMILARISCYQGSRYFCGKLRERDFEYYDLSLVQICIAFACAMGGSHQVISFDDESASLYCRVH